MIHSLFPPLEPYAVHHVPVSVLHTLYVEECGNPNGQPILFLHGGPGAGCSPKHRQLFDPQRYRAILVDQRGAGQSTPHACLEDNTTQHLIADLEQIRRLLNIDQWRVFGGSWGSTLALAYAQAHPNAVTDLILRGIFLCRQEEFDWFYQAGAHWIFPDRWEHYIAPIAQEERHALLPAYYRQLTHPDLSIRLGAAKAWSGWEGSTLHLRPNPGTQADFEADEKAIALSRIECHYFMNGGFLTGDKALLHPANLERIREIPTWIVHGRYDVVCPVRNAWDLHKALPDAQLTIVPDAGHAFDEPGIQDALMGILSL